MELSVLRQHLVGSMGVEATFGDAALLRMLDNFTPVSELEELLAEMAAKIQETMTAFAAPLDEVMRRWAEAWRNFGWTLK